jgi:hypothetical protein
MAYELNVVDLKRVGSDDGEPRECLLSRLDDSARWNHQEIGESHRSEYGTVFTQNRRFKQLSVQLKELLPVRDWTLAAYRLSFDRQ